MCSSIDIDPWLVPRISSPTQRPVPSPALFPFLSSTRESRCARRPWPGLGSPAPSERLWSGPAGLGGPVGEAARIPLDDLRGGRRRVIRSHRAGHVAPIALLPQCTVPAGRFGAMAPKITGYKTHGECSTLGRRGIRRGWMIGVGACLSVLWGLGQVWVTILIGRSTGRVL